MRIIDFVKSFALSLVLASFWNIGPLVLINAGADTTQLWLSITAQVLAIASIGSITLPFTKWSARRGTAWQAYLLGSPGLSMMIAGGIAVLHTLIGTPELWGTVLWTFGLNIVLGCNLVFCFRNQSKLPQLLQKAVKRL